MRSPGTRPQESDPFERLSRSHRRLEEACAALEIATADRDAATIADVVAFFGRQVRRHEEDEEASLFPRLASSPGLAELLDRLKAEHRQQETLATKLDAALGALEGTEELDCAWDDIGRAVDPLVRSYRAHIDTEEKQLFPAARAALPTPVLGDIMDEMMARRT